ncbi:hypothetical protein [Legionella maioricensis]|uniref:NHL repeat protein n=1 Tax=Legionella maioricensis TaxID=2896528 RepID=A0A9X2IBD2_9GAMM|nr:hypothetical protein [Legionella maioricensis]MCL9684829.1 hypothetical protein [Legionella maioricensis]MCL9688509.1 hypothetical protein [Legionella maioricensis]
MTAIFKQKILFLIIILFTSALNRPAIASAPVWTYEALTTTSFSLPVNGSATIQYRVTNQSRTTHTLSMSPVITGITPSGCVNPLGYHQSCILTLQVNGSLLQSDVISGPVLCQNGNPNLCYQPEFKEQLNIHLIPSPPTPFIQADVSSLGLSVNDIAHPALTGNPRGIVITNTGTLAATNVIYSITPALPAGATISPANCGTIAPGASCVLTVTPGTTPSASPGANPNPSVITFQGSNTNSTTVAVNIITYGSVYQQGYVFSVDDTQGCSSTPCTGSVGGTVASLTDQADLNPNGVVWSSNGDGSFNGSNDIIPGIDPFSTTLVSSPIYAVMATNFSAQYGSFTPPPQSLFSSCNGGSDGNCNSNNIMAYYNYIVTGPPTHYGVTTLQFYAPGRCHLYTIDSNGNTPCSTGTCYSGWYVPAICEMGPDSGNLICLLLQQNMVDNLGLLLGDPASPSPSTSCPLGSSCLAGRYWSSTEYSTFPSNRAWYQGFEMGGASLQAIHPKNQPNAVRCVRALTP